MATKPPLKMMPSQEIFVAMRVSFLYGYEMGNTSMLIWHLEFLNIMAIRRAIGSSVSHVAIFKHNFHYNHLKNL